MADAAPTPDSPAPAASDPARKLSSRAAVDATSGNVPQTASTTDESTQSMWWDALHLLTVHAFVISQPILLRLDTNPGYLKEEQTRAGTVWLTILAVMFGIPLGMLLLQGIARIFSEVARQRVHLLCFAFLAAIGLLLMFSTACKAWRPIRPFAPGPLLVVLSLAGSAFLTLIYKRFHFVRSTLTVASIAVVMFPATFLMSAPIREVFSPPPPAAATGPQAARPAPIVMIVFDGLAGMSLVNAEHVINADLFPNFARLAAISDWYRNCSTVHVRTDRAVPAILSGQRPGELDTPFLSTYPQNLFTVLHDSGQYGLTAFEPYTRLCPESLAHRDPPAPVHEQTADLLKTVGLVYLNTTIPHDLLRRPIDIPRAWFSLPDVMASLQTGDTGLFQYPWDLDRHNQLEHFHDTLHPHEQPHLYYLHAVVPHYPWMYFPSGKQYVPVADVSDFPNGTLDEFGEDWGDDPLFTQQAWVQYLLQLQYIDRTLGRYLDKLEAEGMLDDVLLIVTADHGASFAPGRSSRVPTPDTIADLMSVPLFVKRPGQTTGTISERNVETIDILPTLADIIELPLRGEVDGDSFLDSSIPARRNKQMTGGPVPIVVEGDFPQRFEYVDRMQKFYPIQNDNSGLPDLLRPLLGDEKLLGHSAKEFPIGPNPGPMCVRIRGGLAPQGRFVPCLIEGEVDVDRPVELAIAINGIIVGSTRTFHDQAFSTFFSLLLPESTFDDVPVIQPHGSTFKQPPLGDDTTDPNVDPSDDEDDVDSDSGLTITREIVDTTLPDMTIPRRAANYDLKLYEVTRPDGKITLSPCPKF